MLCVGAAASLRKELNMIRQRCRQYEETAGQLEPAPRRVETIACRNAVEAIAQGDAKEASALVGGIVAALADGVLQSISPGFTQERLRMAVACLQENGLIAAEPNFRSRVLGVDPEEVETLYIKRILLESFAAGCTARATSDEGLPTDVSPDGAHFRPEQAQAYEVGFKGLTLDDRRPHTLQFQMVRHAGRRLPASSRCLRDDGGRRADRSLLVQHFDQ
jgi:hypothetical protein